eukprot:TRINITY_DN6265_c0_g1_i1.p1 TRINITY_DN6265_c0_g1~~TRINITY_DN6265_c0_g1_i1.p1  ORF type:complete len:150 (+),score=19.73 TRINITY_DN6265_c0_g1_i1:116-565(+)
MPSQPSQGSADDISGCRRGVRITSFSRPSPFRRSRVLEAAAIFLCSFFTRVEGIAISRKRMGCKEQMWRNGTTPCQTYMETIGCEWTVLCGCPGQGAGEIGDAEPDDSAGYDCCCIKNMWTTAKFFQVRQVPARNFIEFHPLEGTNETG